MRRSLVISIVSTALLWHVVPVAHGGGTAADVARMILGHKKASSKDAVAAFQSLDAAGQRQAVEHVRHSVAPSEVPMGTYTQSEEFLRRVIWDEVVALSGGRKVVEEKGLDATVKQAFELTLAPLLEPEAQHKLQLREDGTFEIRLPRYKNSPVVVEGSWVAKDGFVTLYDEGQGGGLRGKAGWPNKLVRLAVLRGGLFYDTIHFSRDVLFLYPSPPEDGD